MSTVKTRKPSKPRTRKPRALTQPKPYEHFIIDDVVYFGLRGRAVKDGINAMVSLNKWPMVQQYQWYLGKAGYPLCYDLGALQLHRFVYTFVLGEEPPTGFCVDHIDHNKLNNTDFNLRLATPQQNAWNKSTSSNTKGVKKVSEGNYTATVVRDGVKHEIKGIATEQQAAETYNLMAEELFGSFAALNQVEQDDGFLQ